MNFGMALLINCSNMERLLDSMFNTMKNYILVAIFIFIVDRVLKIAALAWCTDFVYVINSYVTFDVVINRGVSWGLLHSTNDFIFFMVSCAIVIITGALCWYAYNQYRQGISILGEICIIAGSVANLTDRLFYSGVVDFIVLSYKNWFWPVFNIADVAIVIGTSIVMFQQIKRP
ncbi:MAG TPA: signal peptidase II [Candidatus Babeliales bacterium]|nr:signal peptidase II [Candidatus Babeliales bacterium]